MKRTIRVEAPGMFTTVQDLGRERYGALGVSAAGAADALALRVGNRLVGNVDSAAALEMTLLGGTFLFAEKTSIAIAGADFGATVDGAPLEMWTAIEVIPGQTLRCGSSRDGARCYLCVGGGIAVESVMGSAATHVMSGLGGFHGRALCKGDEIQIGEAAAEFRARRVMHEARAQLSPRKVLRVTEGPQGDWFADQAQHAFYREPYRVSDDSNRMGLRLEGAAVSATQSRGEMITEGVALGAVQIPESGQPILLFVDQQTTGGYPKIANVIAADMPSVGQLRPRDAVRFERVEFDEARRLLREFEDWLAAEDWLEE
jgi:antagonist of KipI